MHICHVASIFNSGIYHVVRLLANKQNEEGHTVSIIYDTFRPVPKSLSVEIHPDIALTAWSVPREILPLRDAVALIKLISALKKIRPDVIHLHASKAGALGRIAGKWMGIPVVYSPQGVSTLRTDISNFSRRLYEILEKGFALLGGVNVASSNTEFDSLKTLSQRLLTIPNPIDIKEMDEAMQNSANDLAEHRNRKTSFTIAMVGHVTPARNPIMVSRLADASPSEWRWLWIGGGETSHPLENQSRIKVLGWRDHIRALELMYSADIILNASAWEGMPITVLEAMALERPVVASNVVGNKDLIKHGENGFLISHEKDYLPQLVELAENPQIRLETGKRARATVEKNHSIEKINQQWLELYRQQINGILPRGNEI